VADLPAIAAVPPATTLFEQEHLTTATTPASLPTNAELIGSPQAATGIYALANVPFNLLCIPDATRAAAVNPNALDAGLTPSTIYSAAIALCDQRNAMLLIDPPPNVNSVATAIAWKSSGLGVTDPNAAAFFPRLELADALNGGNLRTFAPSGVVAGVYAKTDTASGVWKAPAGIAATLQGVQGMACALTDAGNGTLNTLGINCFRIFPASGPVLWGARTLASSGAAPSEWQYVPVRRTALFIEASIYAGTQWVVFEPNAEPLWGQVRLSIGIFMQSLFVEGAFQGATPQQAYFVKCDSETTTQADIDNGIVNIVVGFAPLEPAEFVVLQIQQLAGQGNS
jgi:phage tail sheath protein FI